jgi:hypothetical protein
LPIKSLFKVETPLGFSVRCTRRYWDFIVRYKHPTLAGQEETIRLTLEDPDQIRRSRKDNKIFLFYRGKAPRWICAVAKRENGEGFLVTAYPADAIKAGDNLWKKSK